MEPIVLPQLKESNPVASSIVQPPSPSISTPRSLNDHREGYFSPVQKAVSYKSRFKEHFEVCKNSIDKEQPSVSPLSSWYSPKLRPGSLEAMRSLSETIISSHPVAEKPTLVRSACTTIDAKLESNLNESTISQTAMHSPKMMASLSTPQSILSPSVTGKNDESQSLAPHKAQDTTAISDHSQFSFSDQSISTASMIATNLNRADVLIQRLETWYTFLKSVVGWVEEVAKTNQQSSRGYSQKAKSCLDVHFGEDNIAKSLISKLQSINSKAANDQLQFSKTLHHDHLSNLQKLRKECKGKIQVIRMDSTLSMDELYRRAEITQRKMKTLNRCCKQAEKSNGVSETDPWLANLYVLRQLKREVDEENRLRLLMIPIQKEVKSLEARILEAVQSTFTFCCKHLLPHIGSDFYDDSFNAMKTFIETVVPEQEWEQFINTNKKEIVDENYPVKDYIKINYTNKFHPLVMTLIKGKLEKKSGARKQFVEKYYVLSQGGYLHQFTLDNKVSPEKTIYIPSTTATFPFEARNPSSANSLYMHYKEEEPFKTSNIFEIAKPSTNLLQKEKVSVFRASTKEALYMWCNHLTKASNGFNIEGTTAQVDCSSNLTMISNLNSHFSVSSDSHMDVRHRGLDSEISLPSSPTRSTPLNKQDDPLRHSTGLISNAVQDLVAPLAAFRRSNSSPQVLEHVAPSGVSQFPNVPLIHEHPDFPINSITEETGSLYEEEGIENTPGEDTYSTTSSSTEKDKTTLSEENTLSVMDDAQSSLYFSSTSAPPSPSYSTQSSVVSMPELWNV